jgi:hypothetical protein
MGFLVRLDAKHGRLNKGNKCVGIFEPTQASMGVVQRPGLLALGKLMTA